MSLTVRYLLSSTGYPDGYPVLFDAHLSEKRMLQLLTYLGDGGMLSPTLTKTMTMEVSGADMQIFR
jgi:hypothetical protein